MGSIRILLNCGKSRGRVAAIPVDGCHLSNQIERQIHRSGRIQGKEIGRATASCGNPNALTGQVHFHISCQATRRTKKFLIEDSAKRECPASDRIFRRGEKLAHLNRNELSSEDDVHDKDYHVADDLVIRLADTDWLGDRADRCICYMRPNKDNELVPADVPDKLLRRVEKIITPYDFPHLLGTVETPTLRADHSVLDVAGYDYRSGLYYDPGRAVFPKIEDRPSKAQAEAALALFIGDTGVLHDFPFDDANDEESGLSRSVALAMLLTAVARRTLATAPMFGIDAFEAQSGKTLLAQIAAIMATGRKTAERPWLTNEEERRKNLGAALEAGDPVLLYDNVETPLEGAAFAGAITESKFQDRRLGSNSGKDQIIAPTNTLILATGNHLIAQGDMAEGRVLVTRIVPATELAGRMFIHRDLARYCIEHRPELVVAALTILRAYVTSSTKMPLTGFRHREWGDLIAAAVEWLGLPNPCLAMSRAQAADPVREVHTSLELDPFSLVIEATSNPKKVDRKMRSKWCRVLQFAEQYKSAAEPLK